MATKRHRKFSVALEDGLEPITFEVEFVSKDSKGKEKTETEEFTAHPEVQGAVILEFVSSANDDRGYDTAEQILAFFKNVLEDESEKRFVALLHDKKKIVSIETLTEIVGWLIEEYTDRPTRASE